MNYEIIVNTDASLAVNRKIGCTAWIIKSASGKIIERHGRVFTIENGHRIETTYLELLAIKIVIRRMLRLGFKHKNILIYTDSNSSVDKLWEAKSKFPNRPNNKNLLFGLAWSICDQINSHFTKLDIEWIPRTKNNQADEHARKMLHNSVAWRHR